MPKRQLSLVDITALVRELREMAVGMRVQNVYSIDRKTYLFKIAQPGRPKARAACWWLPPRNGHSAPIHTLRPDDCWSDTQPHEQCHAQCHAPPHHASPARPPESTLCRPSLPLCCTQLNLLVESGKRFHHTNYDREKSPMPLPFAMKLRKHLRNRKVAAVRQVSGQPNPTGST